MPNPIPIPKSPSPWAPVDPTVDLALKSELLLKIHSTIDSLKSSRFFCRFLHRLRDPKIQNALAFTLIQMVLYGVGKIPLDESSRLQLALALLLRRELGEFVESLEVFNPVLSGTECAVMEELGFRVLNYNEFGRRVVEKLTLFYMPHCDAEPYDRLLEANWVKERLEMVVILGNNFSLYREGVEWARGFTGRPLVIGNFLRHLLSVGIALGKCELRRLLVLRGKARRMGFYGLFMILAGIFSRSVMIQS